MGRAYTELTEACRGVTLGDFETLALSTPGVPIARAFAIPDYDPAFPCFPAFGSVTIVVLPRCPDARPQPSCAFLKAVARYVERRRTLATEVHVVGPTYTTVSISARLNADSGVDTQNLTQLAQSTLAGFLNPLHGGPDKTGWPVGRGVYRAEILALLNALPGVVFVDALTLQADIGPQVACANLKACPDGLVASGTHQITVTIYRGK
jgi:predicted phage baseplate assembly protein